MLMENYENSEDILAKLGVYMSSWTKEKGMVSDGILKEEGNLKVVEKELTILQVNSCFMGPGGVS